MRGRFHGLASAALLLFLGAPPPAPQDPFALFQPTLTLTASERSRLDRGETLVRALPAENGEIATFAAVRINADGSRLAEWINEVAQLLRSAVVPMVGRFSSPPRPGDLDSLSLDEDDLDAIRRCQPSDCEIKLTASEIARLRRAIAVEDDSWKSEAQRVFRHIMLERVQAYLAGGMAAASVHGDRAEASASAEVFASLVRHSLYLTEHLPTLADFLLYYPRPGIDSPGESFVYWSKERLAGRTIIGATHVAIVRPGNGSTEVVVAGKQIFASRYMSGLLNMTTVVRSLSGQHYLVYLNRSHVDVLDRWFGGVARMVIERRVRGDAAQILQGLRMRLESGPPGTADAVPS